MGLIVLFIIIAIIGEDGALIKVVARESLELGDLFGGALVVLHQLLDG